MAYSLLAVLGGFAAMALLVMITTAIAATLLIPGGMMAMAQPGVSPPRAYMAANLLCSAVAALAGGMITARLAPTAPVGHGAALAGLMIVMSLVSMRQARGRQPRWYQLLLLSAMPLIALLGAWSATTWGKGL